MGQVRIAAEDRFALLTPGLEGAALPSEGEARNLARAVGELARTAGAVAWTTMWDLRSLRGYGDRRYGGVAWVLDAVLDELHNSPSPQPVLVRPGQAKVLAAHMGWWDGVPQRSPILEMATKVLPKRSLDLRAFQEEELDPYEVFDTLPASIKDYQDAAIALGIAPEDEDAPPDPLEFARHVPELSRLSSTGATLQPELLEPVAEIWAEAIEERRVDVIRQIVESVATNSVSVQSPGLR